MSPRHLRRAALGGALGAVLGLGACQLLFPFTLDNLTETRIRAACHLAYACCTPVERQQFLAFAFANEGACVSELSEDAAGGGLFAADQIARDAVARGTATYDGEAAERCSRAALEANNACDAAAFFTGTTINFNKAILLVDDSDPECLQLAQRGFTRGTLDEGDECESDVECADFGLCIDDPDVDADEIVTIKGICQPLHGEGDECGDGVPCQPGLACDFGGGGGEPTCITVDPAGNGEACTVNSDCESNFCEDRVENGTCFSGGEVCVVDADCAQDGDFCLGDFVSECADPPEVTIEVCDGQ